MVWAVGMNVGLLAQYQSRIRGLGRNFDVNTVVTSLAANADLWNQHSLRTEGYGPHSQVSDIWVRYNAFSNFDGDRTKFNEAHESVWYPAARKIEGLEDLVMEVFGYVKGTRLGGVLITKIPAHGKCARHVDTGWHATYYEKFAVSLAANKQQEFCFDGESLVTNTGDLFTFNNSYTHWVNNDSDEDRMTLICCIRRT